MKILFYNDKNIYLIFKKIIYMIELNRGKMIIMLDIKFYKFKYKYINIR